MVLEVEDAADLVIVDNRTGTRVIHLKGKEVTL